jgi:hypothetical protein
MPDLIIVWHSRWIGQKHRIQLPACIAGTDNTNTTFETPIKDISSSIAL